MLYFTRAISQTLIILIVLISPLVAIAFFLYRFRLKARFLAMRGKAVEYVRQHPIVRKGPIFVVLAATLFLDPWPRYEGFSEILGISHILFEPQVSGLSPKTEMIRSAISNQGSRSDTTTASVFFNCLLFLIEAVVLLYLAWHVTTDLPSQASRSDELYLLSKSGD